MARLTLKGLHQVRKVNADGSETWHIYAWRGGPKIASARSRVFVADDALITAYQRAHSVPSRVARSDVKGTLQGLLCEWRASGEFKGLSEGTRKDYNDQVAKIEQGSWTNPATGKSIRLSELRLQTLEDKRVRAVLLAWRDENFSATPRTADKVIGTLSACLSWAVGRGKLGGNPLLGTTKLHKTNRSEAIWTDVDLERVRPHCSPDLWRAVQVASLTGLSLVDLVLLPWSAFDGEAIEGVRQKTGRSYLVPVLPELADVLKSAPKRSTIILTNAHGQPWSKSGLSHAFGEARTKAELSQRLVFHDLRGTAATRFVAGGLTYAQVGAILGWDEKRVEAIAKRYVDRRAVVSAMLGRLSLANSKPAQ
jgi:integrase